MKTQYAISLLTCFAVAAAAATEEEVTYMVTPPRMSLGYEALQKHEQVISLCQVLRSDSCERTANHVFGPIAIASAIDLLQTTGSRPGQTFVYSESKVAELHWRTGGGATVEIYELEQREWKRRWSYTIPY